MLRFWLDRGVDGFRIDVAHGLAKDPGMPDLSGRFATSGLAHSGHPHWDRDEVHEVFRSWRRVLDGYPGDRMFVAEAYLADATRLARYVRSDELHTAFNFRFLMATWDVAELRAAVDETLTSHAAVGAPATWVLSNHDVVRTVTRYGGGVAGHRRARAAALLMFALPGSAYVYQGEELGLPEVVDLPDSARQDPTYRRTGGALPGRDGCRVPIPWDAERPACGFSPTGASWLPQPRDWSLLSRDRQQRDGSSMLHLYRRAIALRRSLGTAAPGAAPFEWLDLGPDVLAFCVRELRLADQPRPDAGPAPRARRGGAVQRPGRVGPDHVGAHRGDRCDGVVRAGPREGRFCPTPWVGNGSWTGRPLHQVRAPRREGVSCRVGVVEVRCSWRSPLRSWRWPRRAAATSPGPRH